MRKIVAIMIVLCCYSTLLRSSCLDSLKKDSLTVKKLEFHFALDFRNSFIRNSEVSIYGAQVGMRVKRRHLFTLGAYTLTNDGKINFKNNNKNKLPPGQTPPPVGTVLTTELDMYFLSLSYSYELIDRERIEVSLPLEVGFGFSVLKAYLPNEQPYGLPVRSRFIPIQAGVMANWHITRWVGVIGSVGYRLAFESDVRQNYDGWYYHVGAAFYLGVITSDYKAWKVKRKQKAASAQS